MSLPAVNRRFADVDEILLEIARTPGRTRHATDRPQPDSLRSFLIIGLTALARVFARDPVRRAVRRPAGRGGRQPRDRRGVPATLEDLRAEGLTWVDRAKASGEVVEHVDGDLLLDFVPGSACYRLLWRGEAILETEVARVVDLVLKGAAPISG